MMDCMTRNLETADRIVKLSLSGITLILYVLNVIQGPFAHVLMIVSVAVIALYFLKLAILKDQ
jgi:hypothetical protein